MSGRKSRSKGRRREQEAVNRFKEWGLHAERNLSQTRDGGHDVDVYLNSRRVYRGLGASPATEHGPPLIGEVKGHAKLPITKVREWLGENDWLLLQEDRQERLYVLPERVFKELVS